MQIYIWTIAIPAVAAALLSCGGSTNPTVPDHLVAVNGTVYKGAMGSEVSDQPLSFQLVDKSGNIYPNKLIRFELLDGDGALVVDSGITNPDGIVTARYNFSGSRGDAIVSAQYPNIASPDLVVRASTIRAGVSGQGQFITFADSYEQVRQYNGSPASVDPDPRAYINYANYEAALGVVVILADPDSSETASDNEEVLGVILNTVYTGKSADSIGIGSTIADLRAAYGIPDTIKTDMDPPAAAYIRYNSLGLTCYGERTGDTAIFEIHVVEPPPPGTQMPALKQHPLREAAGLASGIYRSHQF